MSSSESQNNCISLNGENYDGWALKMKAYLKKLKIWYTIDKTPELPTAVDIRAISNSWTLELYQFHWEEDAENAIDQITSYCDEARMEEVNILKTQKPDLTPRNLWDHFKTRYQKRDTAVYIKEWSRLINMRMTDENLSHEKMKQHVDLFNQLCDKINAMDKSIEKVFTTLFLLSMPKSYSSLIDVLTAQEGLTRETAIHRVLYKSERDSRNGSDTITAMVATSRNRPRKPNTKKCSHCQKPGHLEDDCWIKHPEKRPQQDTDSAPSKKKRLRVD